VEFSLVLLCVIPFVVFWVYAGIAFFALDTKIFLLFIGAGFRVFSSFFFSRLLLFFGIWKAVLAVGIWFRMRTELW
jgi:hypothetical protein